MNITKMYEKSIENTLEKCFTRIRTNISKIKNLPQSVIMIKIVI